MRQRLASSKERRLQEFRQHLVVDLFTQHGLFWEQVCWVRNLNAVTAETRLPPALARNSVHFPAWLKAEPGGWTLAQRSLLQEWMVSLHVLHEAIVPDDLKVVTRYANSLDFWMGFLSACLVYDPPPEHLLKFAEHGVAAYGDFINPFNPWDDEDVDGPEMLAPPIRFLPDPETLIADERKRHEWILEHIQDVLAQQAVIETSDLDLLEMAAHFERIYLESTEDRELQQLAEMRPYIDVTEQTTEEDVRNAFRLMVAHQPVRPQPSRPRRNPLHCLQCAVWYDECGWSHEQIAKVFGWKVQRPLGAKPKSETARKHIQDGRLLLSQRKLAA
jgi:hypothetical protein